jgi:DNA polymerase elongation subunit (family B)
MRKIINVDFLSLYPNVMKDWTKDEEFMSKMRELARKKLIEERKRKLEKINGNNV